jgi:H+-transporting ATPase
MMTLYSVRTKGAFWSVPPAKPLALATGKSVIISTLLAIFGFFGLIKPIGLGWALFNSVYCFICVLIIDWFKIRVDRFFK